MDGTLYDTRHHHDSSGDLTPPGVLATPNSISDAPRGVLVQNSFFTNPNGSYTQLLQSGGLAGNTADSFDIDDMKRALDLSSLPNNPISGLHPQIEPTASTYDPAPLKRQRHSPSFGTPGLPNVYNNNNNRNFTPRNISGSYQSPIMATGAVNMPQSPIHLGGPLSTPNQPLMSPGATGLTMPQTPLMGLMNGMGMGYGANMPYMGYPGSPIMSPSMNPNTMTGNYGPAAAAAAAAAAGNTTGRTVYVGNLPAEASVDELLNLVRFGPIECVKLLPEKSCVFISFLDGSTAAAFHADASVKKLALHGQELKIGWGKASSVPPSVVQAVTQSQATRNVFVGNLEETTNEQDLRNICAKFGPIDQVKIVRDKNIGFIHFLSISAAIKVVQQLPREPGWEEKRVFYGKDRCAYVPRAQQAAVQAAQAQAAAAISSQHAQMPGSPYGSFSPMTPSFGGFGTPGSGFGSPIFQSGYNSGSGFNPDSNIGNRNVYLGNISPETSVEDICNGIRGGVVQQVRHMKDKGIAFVTFVDSGAAMQFYQNANVNGLTINTRRLKIGWGKHSGPLSPALLQAIQSGASRNVYIGSVPDFDVFNEAKLREDFAEHGEIEMINFLKEKKAAFVNFTSISSAQKAIECVKEKPEYAGMRISFGKDRCAGAWRVPGHGTPGGVMRPSNRTASNQTQQDSPPNDAVSARIAAIERGEPLPPLAPVNGHEAPLEPKEESFE